MGQSISSVDVVAKNAPKHDEFAGRGAAVVTGSTTGIGVPTTEAMLEAGFDRVFACARDANKAAQLQADIKAKFGDAALGRLTIVECDLSDLNTVRSAAEKIDRESGKAGVAVLLNNAGIMATPFAPTKQEFESQIGVNHLSHVLLTDLLTPALLRAADANVKRLGNEQSGASRVIFVASETHRVAPGATGFDVSKWRFDESNRANYSPFRVYGSSKLCNVLSALALDSEFQAKRAPIAAFSVHPGMVDTGLTRGGTQGAWWINLVPGKSTPAVGASTSVFCAIDPAAMLNRGGYFGNAKAAKPSDKAKNSSAATAMLAESRRLLAPFAK